MTLTRLQPIEIALPGIPSHRLLHVPGGEFLMGSADDDQEAWDDKKTAHRVQVDDFYIGEFPVTQDLWEAVTGENPSRFIGPRRPVAQISWDDIDHTFLPTLSEKTGVDYRLPTEAEWEYAARGGPFWKSEPYRYAGSALLKQVGWYHENSDDEIQEVGLLLPNALDLFDMSGNVSEWCSDWYDSKYYKKCHKKGLVVNPTRLQEGTRHVRRGGSWLNDARSCRSAYRHYWLPDDRYDVYGFRLALSLQSVV